jgi:hypothetical protein
MVLLKQVCGCLPTVAARASILNGTTATTEIHHRGYTVAAFQDPFSRAIGWYSGRGPYPCYEALCRYGLPVIHIAPGPAWFNATLVPESAGLRLPSQPRACGGRPDVHPWPSGLSGTSLVPSSAGPFYCFGGYQGTRWRKRRLGLRYSYPELDGGKSLSVPLDDAESRPSSG